MPAASPSLSSDTSLDSLTSIFCQRHTRYDDEQRLALFKEDPKQLLHPQALLHRVCKQRNLHQTLKPADMPESFHFSFSFFIVGRRGLFVQSVGVSDGVNRDDGGHGGGGGS